MLPAFQGCAVVPQACMLVKPALPCPRLMLPITIASRMTTTFQAARFCKVLSLPFNHQMTEQVSFEFEPCYLFTIRPLPHGS
jgi:hypothetical protein